MLVLPFALQATPPRAASPASSAVHPADSITDNGSGTAETDSSVGVIEGAAPESSVWWLTRPLYRAEVHIHLLSAAPSPEIFERGRCTVQGVMAVTPYTHCHQHS